MAIGRIIRQIVPARGKHELLTYVGPDRTRLPYVEDPIIGWALIEDADEVSVEPVTTEHLGWAGSGLQGVLFPDGRVGTPADGTYDDIAAWSSALERSAAFRLSRKP